MVSANGKQQTAGLNCTAKFPRAATRILPISLSLSRSLVLFLPSFRVSSIVSVPFTPPHNAPFPFSFSPPAAFSSLDRMMVQRGGCCGIACVCKSCVREGVALERRVNMHVCATRGGYTRTRIGRNTPCEVLFLYFIAGTDNSVVSLLEIIFPWGLQ